MPIHRRRKQLANGTERTYTYQELPDGSYHQLSSRDSSDSSSDSSSGLLSCYRSTEKKRTVAALLANSSLLIIGEPGGGKSFLGEVVKQELIDQGFKVASPEIGTVKQILLALAQDLGVDTETWLIHTNSANKSEISPCTSLRLSS